MDNGAKNRGKVHFFGVWADPDAALREYLDQRDDLHAGRAVDSRRLSSGCRLADLLNEFLSNCEARQHAGEISARTFEDYFAVSKIIVGEFGKQCDPALIRPTEFTAFRRKIADQYSTSRVTKIVTVTKMIIKWGYESDILKAMPKFGPDFRIASKRNTRQEKAQTGKKLFSHDDIQRILDVADVKWTGIVLLCLNAGLGNTDVANLRESHIQGTWLHLARQKTGLTRRCPLWTETRKAIEAVLEKRWQAKNDSDHDRVFLSNHGGPLITVRESGRRTDLTVEGCRRFLKAAGIYRKGMGLYWLRHTFQTIGDEARDPIATASIMGHVDNSISGHYREEISDDRLVAVTDHVRTWLFGS